MPLTTSTSGDGSASALPTARISRKPSEPAASASVPDASAPFTTFIERYRAKLRDLFERRVDADALNAQRGLPPFLLREIRDTDPLSVYVAEEHGGRGGHIHEGLAMLEATGYESLGLCLTFGINGALFLQPVGKYGSDDTKTDVLQRFLRDRRLGGLMITEPDHGTDALNMRTTFEADGERYRIHGTKHWGGLTGWADYWLLTAREQTAKGPGRDIGFFVCDVTQPEQHIEVEEVYENLGLRIIPYGRNQIDVSVPQAQRLEPDSTGIKMMLDLLHRSRMQFPGMSTGFLRRLLDETVDHCRERFVGGKPLEAYDNVKATLAKMQAYVTSSRAMSLFTSEHGGTDRDLSGMSLAANAIKTSVTDWMQQASQSFLQLCGAKGYRMDHLAGRATVDSRPFQIFEGANDILYQQVAEAVLKQMRRAKESNLYRFLQQDDLTARAADYFRETLSFDVDLSLPQRKLVALGEALSRVMSMEMTIELGERGYRADLIEQALTEMHADVQELVTRFRTDGVQGLIDDYRASSDWLQFVQARP
ncbi:MAG: acyl-CoA dehydrogenase family protein [Bacteroidota bacterium]